MILLTTLSFAIAAAAQTDGMARREASARKLLANGKPYRAISLLSGAIGREDRAVFHALRAEAYNSIGGYDKARADARMALAQSPGLQ